MVMRLQRDAMHLADLLSDRVCTATALGPRMQHVTAPVLQGSGQHDLRCSKTSHHQIGGCATCLFDTVQLSDSLGTRTVLTESSAYEVLSGKQCETNLHVELKEQTCM
jgi:hypothetical protein